jgi:hypothetical protein
MDFILTQRSGDDVHGQRIGYAVSAFTALTVRHQSSAIPQLAPYSPSPG